MYLYIQDIVLCKIYRKATSLKVLEQRAAEEEEMKQLVGSPASPPSSTDTKSFSSQQEDQSVPLPSFQHVVLKKEAEAEEMVSAVSGSVPRQENPMTQKKTCGTSLLLPSGNDNLPDLQLPMMVTDWTQDNFWAQLNSPWLQNLTPNYSNVLNF